MGLLDDELPPGHVTLRPCPNCGEDKVYREGSSLRGSVRYFCDGCGKESSKSEVEKSIIETLKTSSADKGQEEVSKADIHQMKLTPELAENEELLFVQPYSQNSITNNLVLAVTSHALYIRPKKGKKVNNELAQMGISGGDNITQEEIVNDIPLEEIEALRQNDGILTSKMEIDTNTQAISFPSIPKDKVDIIAELIVEQAELVVPDWKKEEPKKSHTGKNTALVGVAGISISVGVLGALFGLMFVLMGVLVSLTIIGAIIGVPIIIFGVMIMYVSMFTGILGAGSLTGLSSGDTEWVKT